MSSSERDDPPPSTSSIFANAARTRRHVDPAQGPARATLVCSGCGAPRLEGDVRLVCGFCGSALVPRAVSSEP